jgi:hypothetical protein
MFATISYTSFDPVICGGETRDYNFNIRNDFSYDINAVVDTNFWNTVDGDTTGMTFTVISPSSFMISAYDSNIFTIRLSAVTNIDPTDNYNFSVWATYYLVGSQVPIRVEVYSGGGTRYVDKDIYIDRNIIVSQEVPAEIIRNNIIDRNIYIDNNILANVVFIDKNIYIKKPYIPNEWIAFYLIAGGIIIGSITFIYFSMRSNKEFLETSNGGELNGNTK